MLIFAHRGVKRRGIADENSLEAFKAAVELGIDGIELDVRLTRDGKAVIMHDADLRRVAGDNRKVESLTYRELSDIELRNGSSVPLLDDVTACVPEPIRIDFEVKDPEALAVVAKKLNTSAGLRARSMISMFNEDVAVEAMKLLPDMKRYLLLRRWPIFWSRFVDHAREIGITGLGFATHSWTAARVRKAKELGFEAITWEQYELRSSRKRAARLQRIGVDVAIVNDPRKYLG